MKRILLALIPLVVVLASVPIAALDKAPDSTFFIIQKRLKDPARAYLVDPERAVAVSVSDVKPGSFNRQIVVPGMNERTLLYCLDEENNQQSAYVFDTGSHTLLRRLELGAAPPTMLLKECYWILQEGKVVFFGNMGSSLEGTIVFYDIARDDLKTVSVKIPLMDAGTDGRGSIYIALANRTFRQYTLADVQLLHSVPYERLPWGVVKLGNEMLFIDCATTHGSYATHLRITRYDGDMIPRQHDDFGFGYGYRYIPQTGVLVLRGRSSVSILGESGRRNDIPVSRSAKLEFDPTGNYMYIREETAISEVNLRDSSTTKLMTGYASLPRFLQSGNAQIPTVFQPEHGGGSGILYTPGTAFRSSALVADFKSSAFLWVSTQIGGRVTLMSRRAAVVYLRELQRVVVYDPSPGQIRCLSFPSGDEIGRVEVGKTGQFLLASGDGRRAILIGPDKWVAFDATDLSAKTVHEWAHPTSALGDLYLQRDAEASRLLLLKSDGIYLFDLPGSGLRTRIPCDWAGTGKTSDLGELILVASSESSL